MQITLEGRLLVTALVIGLFWALSPRPNLTFSAWIESGTSIVEQEAFQER